MANGTITVKDTSKSKGGYWDAETIVAELPKDDFAKYVVSACVKNGKKFVNVREWYHTSYDPTWKPSKSGMAIPVGVAQDLVHAIEEALVQALK